MWENDSLPSTFCQHLEYAQYWCIQISFVHWVCCGAGKGIGGIAASFAGYCCCQYARALTMYSVFKMKLGRKLPCPVSVNSSLQLLLLHAGLPSGLSNCEKTSQLFNMDERIVGPWRHHLPHVVLFMTLWFKFWGKNLMQKLLLAFSYTSFPAARHKIFSMLCICCRRKK